MGGAHHVGKQFVRHVAVQIGGTPVEFVHVVTRHNVLILPPHPLTFVNGENIIPFPGRYRLDISGAGGMGARSGQAYNVMVSWGQSSGYTGKGGDGGNGYTNELEIDLKYHDVLSISLGAPTTSTGGPTIVNYKEKEIFRANGGAIGSIGGNTGTNGSTDGKAGANDAGGNGAKGGTGGARYL